MLCCIQDPSFCLFYTIYIVCALCKAPSLTPSTDRVLDLRDPSSLTDYSSVEKVSDMPYCGSTGLGQRFNRTYVTVKLFVKPMPNHILFT